MSVSLQGIAELEKSQKRCAALERIIGGTKGTGESLNLDDLNNLAGDKGLEKLASEAQSLKGKLSNTGLSREMAMGAFVGSARQVGMTPQGYTVTVPDVPKRMRTDAGDAEIGRMRAEMDALRAENSKLRADYQGLSSQFIQLATQFASSRKPETPATPSARPATPKPEDGDRVDEEMDDLEVPVDRAATPLPVDDQVFAQAVKEEQKHQSFAHAVKEGQQDQSFAEAVKEAQQEQSFAPGYRRSGRRRAPRRGPSSGT
jgi:hypothetical protein